MVLYGWAVAHAVRKLSESYSKTGVSKWIAAECEKMERVIVRRSSLQG